MDPISYASNFASQISLWLGLLIGFIACVLVFRSAAKMGGGLFGSVLHLFGLGMLMVLLGTISTFFQTLIPLSWVELSKTVLFSLGYILMVLGANKMLRGIMS